MKHIGFIGLGNMGLPMALNLKSKGFDVIVTDVVESILAQAEAQGLRITKNLTELVAGREAIITMLPSGKHSKDVYGGNNGLINRVEPHTALIDCSTIEPSIAQEIAEQAKKKNLELLDAPVSGGVKGAQAGTLAFIVGGSAETLKQTEHIFLAMGKKAFHAGASGAGQISKLCNNLLLAVQMIGVSEAMNLGVANRLDPKVLTEIISNSTGACWSVGVNNPIPGVFPDSPSSKEYQGGFKANLMLKDLRLALDLARKSNCPTQMGDLAEMFYGKHAESGFGDLDFSGIIKSLNALD